MGTDTQHPAWDEQLVLLSAYLDGEVSLEERQRLEQHLVECRQCQAALDGLREVRGLLRAMPAPSLPRSFVLPVEIPAPAQRSATRSARFNQPDRAAPSAAARAAQWLGGLAATIGVGLVIGGAVIGGHTGSSVASSAGSSRAANTSTQQTYAPGTTSAANPPQKGPLGPNVSHTQTTAATPTSSTATSPTNTSTSPTGGTPVRGNVSMEAAPPLSLTGAGLALGGVALLVGGQVAERRGRRNSTDNSEE